MWSPAHRNRLWSSYTNTIFKECTLCRIFLAASAKTKTARLPLNMAWSLLWWPPSSLVPGPLSAPKWPRCSRTSHRTCNINDILGWPSACAPQSLWCMPEWLPGSTALVIRETRPWAVGVISEDALEVPVSGSLINQMSAWFYLSARSFWFTQSFGFIDILKSLAWSRLNQIKKPPRTSRFPSLMTCRTSLWCRSLKSCDNLSEFVK